MTEKNFIQVGNTLPETHDFKNNSEIQGILIEKKEIVVKKFSKDQLKLVYIIDTGKQQKAVWGSGLLDYLMKDIQLKEYIKIIFLGKAKVKGFKNELLQFQVYKAE